MLTGYSKIQIESTQQYKIGYCLKESPEKQRCHGGGAQGDSAVLLKSREISFGRGAQPTSIEHTVIHMNS